MALWLYNLALILASPLILAVLLGKARCRPGLPYRLGLRPPVGPTALSPDGPVIWVHAVSLGEVVAVAPLVKALRARDPKRRIVVSTVTETGREAVLERLAGVAAHCYAPLDFPWVVRTFIRRLRPTLYVFVETELWPNLLSALEQERVPTVLVNGRISSRSFARQQWPGVRRVYRGLLERISLCLMQSDRDAERAVVLGAPPERVRRVGNIKFDQPLPAAAPAQLEPIRRWIALAPDAPLVVAGSTHPGEEEALVHACATLRTRVPDLRLIIAPRHIERAKDLEVMLAGYGLRALRRSRLADGLDDRNGDAAPWVLLLDTRGELGAVYQFATLAFVGGTLVPVGGHNLLEPAAWGKPVLFGPHTDHCQDIARLLEGVGGGIRVPDGDALGQQIGRWLGDEERRMKAGRQAEQAVRDNQGALRDCLALIEPYLAGERIEDQRPRSAPQGPSISVERA